MVKSLIKQPKFWVSFIFIIGWLVASLVYYFMSGDKIPHPDITYNKYGYPDKYPPYTPLENPPLGSDDFNRNIFFVLLAGAKYTLGLALVIAFFRVILGFLFGTFSCLYFPRPGKWFITPFESFGVFPMTLLAYFLLKFIILLDRKNIHVPPGSTADPPPVFNHSLTFRVITYSLVLVALAVPLTTSAFYKMTDSIMQREFLESTRTLGGSRWHILTRHLPPYFVPQLFIVFLREMIQVLILMTHLGVLDLFIGGSFSKERVLGGYSMTGFINDWSALVGQYWHLIYTNYAFIALIPITALTLATLSAKGILSSVERALHEKHDSLNDEKKAA